MLAGTALAQGWPSAAYVSPESGLPPVLRGRIWMGYNGEFLEDEVWQDSRHKVNFHIGLTNHLGLSLGGSTRDMNGFGSFQRGPEDSRLGVAYWPFNKKDSPLRVGLNANFLLPTGYRETEPYYDSLAGVGGTLPAFSMKQTGGELFLGTHWNPAPIAEVNLFGGYFSSSDRVEQSFRWGSRLWLAPFGGRVTAELGFAQAFTRVGVMPNTQVMTTGLAISGPWGFQIVPGFSADLADQPVYGMNVGLRFEGQLSHRLFPERVREPVITRHRGTILIASPLASVPLADREELWKSLQHQLEPAFENVEVLETLDQPGLPFQDESSPAFWNSMEAIALAFPEARWLLITDVDREELAASGGVKIPLLFSQPNWKAECRMRVRLIHLGALEMAFDRVVSATAQQRQAATLSFVSTDVERGLSLAESRALTIEAYQLLARRIAESITLEEKPDEMPNEIHVLGDRR